MVEESSAISEEAKASAEELKASAEELKTPAGEKSARKEEKKSKLPAFLCVLVCICLLLNLGTLGILGYLYVDRQEEKKKQAEAEYIPPTTEDDVVIFGDYTIRSTLPISDAYKSGDTSALSDADKETLEMASAVLAEIITDDMTAFDKEVAAYTYLTTNLKAERGMLTVINTPDTEQDNPHGVLKNGSAVCVGFATTFRLFMQMMDIPCMVIHSMDFVHSWDLVQLDGDWYHVDCYSDQDSGNFSHFNLNDNTNQGGYDWDTEFFPAATGTKYDYVCMNATELENIYALPAHVLQCIRDNQHMISATFKERITPETEAAADVLLTNLCNTISMVEGMAETYSECSWRLNPAGEYVACITISFYGDPTPVLDDETMAKVNEAIYTGLGLEYYEDPIEPVPVGEGEMPADGTTPTDDFCISNDGAVDTGTAVAPKG